MRSILILFLIFSCCFQSFAQDNSRLKFIFVPHPRSEDKVNQSVLPGIEKIDFSLYDMTLLGGDLTYYTSLSRTSMDYCDKLFSLKSPNTLWSFGNHDLNSRSLVQEYTGRPSFYTYYRGGITFLVLDTELNANGFISTTISGAQMNLLRTVSDSISKSGYLVVLHSRLMWMIGNDDFKTRIDSVAESTRQMVSTNFYTAVFPLLQKVKAKGIPVICLGGDKSKIDINYSPEDSIRFFASTMAPEFTDKQNQVMVFSYSKPDRMMGWRYVSLADIEKKTPEAITLLIETPEQVLKVWQTSGTNEIGLQVESVKNEVVNVQIYSTGGKLCQSIRLETNKSRIVSLKNAGFFVVKATVDGATFSQKIAVQ